MGKNKKITYYTKKAKAIRRLFDSKKAFHLRVATDG
jgi:hypothetical protein